jgi:hypothetical protein
MLEKTYCYASRRGYRKVEAWRITERLHRQEGQSRTNLTTLHDVTVCRRLEQVSRRTVERPAQESIDV